MLYTVLFLCGGKLFLHKNKILNMSDLEIFLEVMSYILFGIWMHLFIDSMKDLFK